MRRNKTNESTFSEKKIQSDDDSKDPEKKKKKKESDNEQDTKRKIAGRFTFYIFIIIFIFGSCNIGFVLIFYFVLGIRNGGNFDNISPPPPNINPNNTNENSTIYNPFKNLIRYINYEPPTRLFGVGDYLVDQSFINASFSPCKDFYSYSCGNYNLKENNDLINILDMESYIYKVLITKSILENDASICVVDGNACYSMLEFYRKCTYDKIHGLNSNNLKESLINELNKISNKYEKIRFLIKNGITNYIHLTREDIGGGIWAHYMRPGGVLEGVDIGKYREKRLIDLYGKDGLEFYGRKSMKIKDFINVIKNANWMKIFGDNALESDELIIENIEYFINLNAMLNLVTIDEVERESEWFIKIFFSIFENKECMEITKILFPITLCKTFRRISKTTDLTIAEEIKNKLHDNMLKTYKNHPEYEYLKESSSIEIGTCSSILYSNTMGDHLFDIENQENITEKIKLMNHIEWAHEYLFKKWYKIYDPIYLYYSYPRSLDPIDEKYDDTVDWYLNPNGFYIKFKNIIIIPPGFAKYPLYQNNYCECGKFSRIGYVFSHEMGHPIQEYSNLTCLNFFNKDKIYEIFADIIGLSNTFETYFNETKDCREVKKFLISYAQTFCTMDPDRIGDGIHGTPRERVNIPIYFGSNKLNKLFNECFGCKVKNCNNF